MASSIVASALLTVLCGIVPHWGQLLAVRALLGITVSGLPAIAMAYLSEEVHPGSIGLAMGLYIGGNGFGGMAGRLLTGIMTDLFGWRAAMVLIGLIGLVAAALFWRGLPPSRHHRPRKLQWYRLRSGFGTALHDRVLMTLFAEGFLLMGGFVTVYNYIGYRLLAPPYALSQSVVGMIFSVYLVGVFSSPWMGALGSRLGRGRVLWTGFGLMLAGNLLTLVPAVPAIVLGIALLTFGFFGGHAVASAWVGAQARQAKAQASALYLFSYYMGSSVAGSVSGLCWDRFGWPGVIAVDVALLVVGLMLALRLRATAETAVRV